MTPLDPSMLAQTESVQLAAPPSAVVYHFTTESERRVDWLASPPALVSSICCVCLSRRCQISNTNSIHTTSTPRPRPHLHIRLQAMPSIILINMLTPTPHQACMREDSLAQCGRSWWVILISTGIAPQTETQAGGATCEEGVACNLCTLRDPSPSLQSKLHQYPARTLNQFVLPLQSTIHRSNYSCSPRRERPIIHRVQ